MCIGSEAIGVGGGVLNFSPRESFELRPSGSKVCELMGLCVRVSVCVWCREGERTRW